MTKHIDYEYDDCDVTINGDLYDYYYFYKRYVLLFLSTIIFVDENYFFCCYLLNTH